MSDFFDQKETRNQKEREESLLVRLRDLISSAQKSAPFYKETLSGVTAEEITSLAELSRLPVVRKSILIEQQQAQAPFGGLGMVPAGEMARLFLSPGPIVEPQGKDEDIWRIARALYATGFRKGEVAHNCFAYHFTPAGIMFDYAARTLGCAVFPGGVGQTEGQVEAINRFQASGYMGTPDFLKIILEKADALGTPITSIKRALVTGGPLFPDLRKYYEQRGITVLQCYATADVGLIAYESPALQGMILDEDVIVEIVRPGTGDLVEDGEVGEVVVTCFNPNYSLIRFATGDLSAILPGQSPCGRTNRRIKGWMGRADQTTKIRGMFVHPEQVARVVASHDQLVKARLEVTEQGGKDNLTFHCEVTSGAENAELQSSIEEAIRVHCRLRGDVVFAAVGSLPNDGKVIDDARPSGVV
ncbi:AMP-binding protein [Kiloniella laminariae]|uniref:AMP-binding protein n=1 Tax=Kiloniella laminariae TaxID=454162 RepID=A0ABT4LN74_9PROT|nr:AMP-binding protein [Kiloniella laminariae]MCZ4282516.1 AMP-binding protein [Kiloniella laminariae]